MVGNLPAYTLVVRYRATTQAVQTLYMEQGTTSNAIRLYFRDTVDNEINYSVRDDGAGCCGTISYAAGSPVNGQRQTIAIVQTAKNARKLLLNGLVVATEGALTLTTMTLTDRRLGNAFNGNSPVNGALEEVLIYTRALSDGEIRDLIQSARQGHPTLLTRGVGPLSTLLMPTRFGSLLPFFLR